MSWQNHENPHIIWNKQQLIASSMLAYFCPLHASYFFFTDYVNVQDTYVKMQDKYVNMQDKYVNMQDNYVNMQDKN